MNGVGFVKLADRAVYLALLVVAFAGCGSEILYVPVTGTVKFKDGGVPQGVIASITFQPTSGGTDVKGASGTIEKDGSFELRTVTPGDGARPGDYAVTVHILDAYPRGKSVVAEAFTKVDTTPLKATVQADEDNHFDFVVERP